MGLGVWLWRETHPGGQPITPQLYASCFNKCRNAIHTVQGHGGETERVETYRGATVKMELQEKVRFEIGVSDHFVEPTVKAVLGAARTGDVGDGKVFVLPVEKIFRIRTGEEDRAGVTPVQVTAAGRG